VPSKSLLYISTLSPFLNFKLVSGSSTSPTNPAPGIWGIGDILKFVAFEIMLISIGFRPAYFVFIKYLSLY
jgi:hypothetical protein